MPTNQRSAITRGLPGGRFGLEGWGSDLENRERADRVIVWEAPQ
jgi:hypothetical protein